MTKFRWPLIVVCTLFAAEAASVSAQVSPKADDLVGTWELVSTKNGKTGAVAKETRTSWMLFTRSHWVVMSMAPGRDRTSTAEYDKLSHDAQVKMDYARVWNEKGEQVFLSRSGTYTLAGDRLHQTAVMATYTELIGVDRVLRIIKVDKTTLVVQTESPGSPASGNEQTYRRID